MGRRELREALDGLADRYQLRFFRKSKRYAGIHRGVILIGLEFDGVITLTFVAPDADFDEDPFGDFEEFEACLEAGVPPQWLSANRDDQEAVQGCDLTVDQARFDEIGLDAFLDLPEAVAEDLEDHGAEESVPCSQCGGAPATDVTMVDWAYVPFCKPCSQGLRAEARGGKLSVEQEVRWAPAILVLAGGTGLGAWLWGRFQQPGVPLYVWAVYALPVLWALGLTYVTSAAARGSCRALRLAIGASVLVSILVGNVTGIQAHMEEAQQMAVPWRQVAVFYFTSYLWQNLRSEIPFLLGGAIGAWIALRLLRSREQVEVE